MAAEDRFTSRLKLSDTSGTGDAGEAVARLMKKNPEKYAHLIDEVVEPPPELAYILTWYDELRAQNANGWRFEPVGYEAILAYRALHDLEMDSDDVSLLVVIDVIWRNSQPKPKTGG